eukprot:scaffold27.g5983.t1
MAEREAGKRATVATEWPAVGPARCVPAGDASTLAVLLESSPSFWRHLEALGGLSAQNYMEQLLVFVNAYLMLNELNKLAVFAVGSSSSHLLYQTSSCGTGVGAGSPAHQILERLQQAMRLEAETSRSSAATETALSSALSRALCFVNRMQRGYGGSFLSHGAAAGPAADDKPGRGVPLQSGAIARIAAPRVLCLLACPDAPSQYIAVMNAIFCAQRSGVLIDGCKLGAAHSRFLQQAAHLTGGTYLRPAKPAALAQYLLSVYAADPFSREFLRLPRPSSVDFRASCFCHKRPIDSGFVCSVCLSIFCKRVPACSTCGSEFSMPSMMDGDKTKRSGRAAPDG